MNERQHERHIVLIGSREKVVGGHLFNKAFSILVFVAVNACLLTLCAFSLSFVYTSQVLTLL